MPVMTTARPDLSEKSRPSLALPLHGRASHAAARLRPQLWPAHGAQARSGLRARALDTPAHGEEHGAVGAGVPQLGLEVCRRLWEGCSLLHWHVFRCHPRRCRLDRRLHGQPGQSGSDGRQQGESGILCCTQSASTPGAL